MNLPDLADGEAVFLDANILVYHFAPHPVPGADTLWSALTEGHESWVS
jgi:hypothetical protein